MKLVPVVVTIGAWLFGAIVPINAAHAESAAEFYNGRQITMLIGTTAGGGYDVFGRMFARYMGKYLPHGNARFIVKNMPGAGGIVAANYTYNIAERDGSLFTVVPREAIFESMLSDGLSQAKFDPRGFLWLGSPNLEVGMIYVSTASGIHSIEEVKKREATLGTSSAVNSTGVIIPKLLNELIGTKFKVISGYPGSMESIVAMERGEVDGRYSPGWAGPEANTVNDLVADGKARLIAYLSPQSSASFSDIPNVMDLATGAEAKQILGLLLAGQGLGRPFFAPPNIPEDRATILRGAFVATMKDPEFLAEAVAQKFEMTPILGNEMASFVEGIYATPEPFLKRAVEMMSQAQK